MGIEDFERVILQAFSGIARLKRGGTRAETRFGLSAKRTSPFKLAGVSVQSTTGSRGVRISSSNGSNAGYTMFRGRVQDYWLPTPLTCFPFTSPPVRHRTPSGSEHAIHSKGQETFNMVQCIMITFEFISYSL